MSDIQRVVLVGFMGAGKSTVGRLVARRIGWRFADLDREIERIAAATIPEIFRQWGERRFRELEREATLRFAECSGIVLASGGGWMVQPGLADVLGPGTFTVWLRVSAETVLARVGPTGKGRPMLAGSNPAGRVERLLAERDPVYARATLTVNADGRTAAEVADEVERTLRSLAV